MGTQVRGMVVLLLVALLVAPIAALAAEEPAPVVEVTEVTAVAVETACDKAVTEDPTLQMGVTENVTGTVYWYDERRPEIFATLGTRNGLRPEAVVAFTRNGEVVAQGCVTDVKSMDCTIVPAPGTPAGAILVGDTVTVMVNGTREALDAKIKKEQRDRMIMTFLSYLALVGDIYIWN